MRPRPGVGPPAQVPWEYAVVHWEAYSLICGSYAARMSTDVGHPMYEKTHIVVLTLSHRLPHLVTNIYIYMYLYMYIYIYMYMHIYMLIHL